MHAIAQQVADYKQQRQAVEQRLAQLAQEQQELTQHYLKLTGAIEALEHVVIAVPVAVDGVVIPQGN